MSDVGWPMSDGGWPMSDGGWPMSDVGWPMSDGGWPMSDGGWPMSDGGWPMSDGGWPMSDGGWPMSDGGWPMSDGGWPMSDGGWPMSDGGWPMADDGCRMGDDVCEVRSGGCGDGERGETTPEVSQGRIVGHDSNHVIDDSTNDKIGIFSHEGMDATHRPYQGTCDRQSLPSGVKMRENVQNEANPESTQSSLPLGVELSVPELPGRKRSQREGLNAPRSTLHAPRLTPTVASGSGGSGEWR